MSHSVQSHRQQPTRLPRPWDSPGKSTGVGCHFLLQCMKVKSQSEVAQSCLTLSDPMDYSPPGSSIHGIFQARVLEWDIKNYFKCKGQNALVKRHRVAEWIQKQDSCIYCLQGTHNYKYIVPNIRAPKHIKQIHTDIKENLTITK